MINVGICNRIYSNTGSAKANEAYSIRDCSEFENDKYSLRLVLTEYTNDLLKVYSGASADRSDCNAGSSYKSLLYEQTRSI